MSGGGRAWHASMSVALALGLGFFVLTSVATVLSVGLVSGYRNTVELLRQKAELLTAAEQDRVIRYLSAAEDQLAFANRMIATGEVDAAGAGEDFTSLLLGALAATPQIVAILYIDVDYQLTGAERREQGSEPIFASVRGDDDLRALVDQARLADGGRWGGLIWRQSFDQALMTYSLPVGGGESFSGVLVALVSVVQLSEFISDLEGDFGGNPFVLYGEDRVLAHPLMAFGYDGLNRLSPLPEQARFGDPVLASMWEVRALAFFEGHVLEGEGIHAAAVGTSDYIFIYNTVEGYADRPLLIGSAFPSSDMLTEVLRFKWAALFCLLVSLGSAAAAAVIGRQIAQPVRRLGEGATRIYHFDLARVTPMPGNFFRELDDTARSFNTMLEGLRWFERYVPRSLVARLIKAHPDPEIGYTFREVVIMFIDIMDFTGLSEDMTAPQTAAFLNEHLTMISDAVEAEGGIVDKFTGDGAMAVWGAPETFPDIADRACRAALDMKTLWEERGRAPTGAGRRPARLRIGLHQGRVVVGNIGSPGRIDYTVVGDAVNVSKRLEAMSRTLGNVDGQVNILVSGALRSALSQPFDLIHLGAHQVRGRREKVEVYLLNGPADETDAEDDLSDEELFGADGEQLEEPIGPNTISK